jgi:prepilin signal peptidase PulO-like enzyme (type II secretory pathway)
MLEIFRLIFFICVLAAISVYDARYSIIPNKIVYPAIPVTIVLALVSPEASAVTSLVSGAVLAAILLVPVLLERMGIGDLKLAFLIGLMTGFPEGIIALFGGIMLGGLYAIVLVVFRIRKVKDLIPYGPFLAAGTIAGLLAERVSLMPAICSL